MCDIGLYKLKLIDDIFYNICILIFLLKAASIPFSYARVNAAIMRVQSMEVYKSKMSEGKEFVLIFYFKSKALRILHKHSV